MAGTAVEFYDFYIFATAASLVFGPLFFPTSSPEAQLLQSWLTFALAFIARPVGALVFGHYGDRIGRKATLVAAGFRPDYFSIRNAHGLQPAQIMDRHLVVLVAAHLGRARLIDNQLVER